ncbi:hypothetical protein VTN00DRAFT_5063 [Thermoascus crustaceus]|uniref:uncharacterized protein n=1 Tax=Thermoascus crustaceus TaxID=5088 RepID=UPI00374276AB
MLLRRKIATLAILLVGTLAIACGIVRMAFYAEFLGPSFLEKTTLGGLSSYDDIGIVSVLMFWEFLEIGVAIVASCLPILHPVWNVLSLDHVFDTVRSFISPRFTGSNHKSDSSLRKIPKDSESQTAITALPGVPTDCWSSFNGITLETYAVGKVSQDTQPSLRCKDGGIWMGTEIRQTSEAA